MSKVGSKRKATDRGDFLDTVETKHTRKDSTTIITSIVSDELKFAETAHRLGGVMNTQRYINGAKFQALLVEGKISAALQWAAKVKVQNIDFTDVYAPSPFISCLHMLACDFTPECFANLLQLYRSAGIVTREAVSQKIMGPRNQSLLGQAVSILPSGSFDFLTANLLTDEADWSLPCSRNGVTPLQLCALAKLKGKDYSTPFDESDRVEFDRRGAKLITMLPDHALNMVDGANGSTPLTYCILNARVLMLEALVARLPVVELQPELRLASKDIKVAIVSVDSALAESNATDATFKTFRPLIASLVVAAHKAMKDYREGLLPLLVFLLQHHSLDMIPNVAEIMCSYLI